MSRWKKILLEVFIAAVFLLVALKLVELWTGVNPLDNLKKRKEACQDINEVAAVLTQKMSEGVEGEVVVYIKNIPEDELVNINYIMSNLNGSVDSFQVHPKLFGVQRVVFKIIRSDNSYVYDAYKNGTSIPDDREQAKLLYEKVQNVLNANVNGRGLTEFETEVVLHDYLVNHCTYSYGSDKNDNEFRAYGALIEGQAVCNGYAEAMALLLSCAGIENQYVVGVAKSGSRSVKQKQENDSSGEEKKENHAWNLVQINGSWYHLDATWDDPVGDKDILSHAYFNLSDELMKRDHTWAEDKYKKCPDMKWNYFYRNRSYFEKAVDLDSYVTRVAMTRSKDVVECAFSQFEITNTTLQGLSTVPGLKSVYYSIVGDFSYSVITFYIE